MSLRFVLLIITGLLFFSSCNESVFEENNTSDDLAYFPLSLGNEWIYEVDSLILQQGGGDIFSNKSFVKEEITATLGEDENSFVITRSVRQSTDDEWVITEVFSGERDAGQAFKTESNRRFTKLVFPIRDGKQWDGNIHFDADVDVDIFGNMFPLYRDWTYEYQKRDSTLSLGGQNYTDLIRVDHVNNDDAIDYVRSYEDYAKGLGLIYKETAHFHTQQLTSTAPWEEKAEYGFRIKYSLVSFK